MDSDIERLVGATGATLPLAGRLLGVILESGADAFEVYTALSIVREALKTTKVKLDHREPEIGLFASG